MLDRVVAQAAISEGMRVNRAGRTAAACILVLTLAPLSPAHAQSAAEYRAWLEWCASVGGTANGDANNPVCTPGGGSSSGQNQYYNGPGIVEIIQNMAERSRNARLNRATEINNQGVVQYNAGNYAAALPLYRQAFEINPNSAVIRINVMMAINGVAYQDLQTARSARDLNALDRIERSLHEVDRLNTGDVASHPDHPTVMNVLARLRADIAWARQEEARARQYQSQLADASRRIASITEDLSASLAQNESNARRDRASPLGFGDPSQAAPPAATLPNTDTSVVDARGPIGRQYSELPRLEEVENSPGREAWLRGMDAIANSDYELAAAWFGTALQRDPTNAALARGLDGTTFVRDQRRLRAAGFANGQGSTQIVAPDAADISLLFADSAATRAQIDPRLVPTEADARLLAEAPTQPIDPRLIPTDADARLLFDQTSQSIGDLYAAYTAEMVARQATSGDAATNARRAFARDMAGQALVRLSESGADQTAAVSDAVAMLDIAARQAPEVPNYAAARDALRQVARYRTERTTANSSQLSSAERPNGPNN
ncbi:MAG: tetratricopeptide repeat protein [Hyphomonadaceae bacterium]|nr:tetratricopeptide repeat protein [Hyphomonadaceae bacterium]